MGDEPRVDGQHLKTPREPGSDQLLSDEAKERIREAIEYAEQHSEVNRDRHGPPRSR